MNKTLILEAIRSQLKGTLTSLERIANQTHTDAIHGELKPEGKYDTQAIEAGYLSGAQAKRVAELKRDLALLSDLILNSGSEISVGSLVELKGNGLYFLSPVSATSAVVIDGRRVNVVTPGSPIGRELIGLQNGDVVEISSSAGLSEDVVLSVG